MSLVYFVELEKGTIERPNKEWVDRSKVLRLFVSVEFLEVFSAATLKESRFLVHPTCLENVRPITRSKPGPFYLIEKCFLHDPTSVN